MARPNLSSLISKFIFRETLSTQDKTDIRADIGAQPLDSDLTAYADAANAAARRTLIGAAADSEVVKLSGNQTISGIKTVSGLVFSNGDEAYPATLFPALGTTGVSMDSVYMPSGTGTLALTQNENGAVLLDSTGVGGTLPVTKGGTGSTTITGARTALGIPTYADLTAANAALNAGDIYFDTALGKLRSATA